eukprot:Lankesteria_metandrocarpae@DN5100_c0_g1_i3.p1
MSSVHPVFLHISPLVLRLSVGVGAVLLVIGGAANVFVGNCYSSFALGYLAVSTGLIAALCEFSPLGLHMLLKYFPFLIEYRARGFYYLSFGGLFLGRELGRFSQARTITGDTCYYHCVSSTGMIDIQT